MSERVAGLQRAELIESLRRIPIAIERGDRDEVERLVAESWHEDCEWVPLIAAVEGASSYRGRAGILAFYEDFWNTFEVHYAEAEGQVLGDAIVALTTMDVRGRESGVDIHTELGLVYEVEGDLIRRGKAYDSHAAALAAAEELNAQKG